MIKAIPFGLGGGVLFTSDIFKVKYFPPELVVFVASELLLSNEISGLEITFLQASAFRYLDELDLARYWSVEKFPFGYHVVEILGGGWADEEILLQGYERKRREWLVVTGNGCLSVFSEVEPTVSKVVFYENE